MRVMNTKTRVNGVATIARTHKGSQMAIYIWNKTQLLTAAGLTALVASCAAGPTNLPNPTTPQIIAPPADPVSGPVSGPVAGAITYASSGNARMDQWRVDFSARAISKGQPRDIVESILAGISPLSVWLGNDFQVASTGVSDQAEFAKPIWEYLRVPLGDTRVTNGREKVSVDPLMFDALEARFGVDREVLVSIWGMETSYGGFPLNFDAANALANMAVEGRRQSFAENELIALMKIISSGDATRDELAAGYAGAMGQTQFMPSTFVAYAADFEEDGHKDVWANRADALASAANYLAASGYTLDEPWGIEVIAPTGFDFSTADGNERRLSSWRDAGLSPIRGGDFGEHDAKYAELWLPAGATGPKYLLLNNFNVFKTYNRADSYAFAVGMLADAIGSDSVGPVAAWPTHLRPLSVADVKVMQTRLNSLGYDAGGADGIPGRRTKGALQDFQKARGIVADGYPTKDMLIVLEAAMNG